MPAKSKGKEPSAPTLCCLDKDPWPRHRYHSDPRDWYCFNQYTLHGHSHGEQKLGATLRPTEQPH